jgi:hypothetical protein
MATAFARWSLVGLGTLLRGALPHWCCDAWCLLHSLRELTLEKPFDGLFHVFVFSDLQSDILQIHVEFG